jgi:hypothetical protein
MHFQRRQRLRALSVAFGSRFIWNRNQLAVAAQTTTSQKSPPARADVRDGIAGGTEMEKVTGIGGFFFRAKDPKSLGLWYQQHLGISVIPTPPGGTRVAAGGRTNRLRPLPRDEQLFRRCQQGLDAELSSARSRQNGGPAAGRRNRSKD